jgi:membrane-associated phospholipid phosphatase
LWGETLVIPLATDAMNTEIAWRMAVINFQGYALTGLITRASHKLITRERPDLEPCHKDAAYSEQCYSGELASFPSGHTSGSFAGAGLMCAHHLGLGLYGNRHADAAACGAALAMGGATGILRMRADRHYASDVLTGAMIGFGAGFALPWFLHYGWPEATTHRASLRWAVVPWAHGDTFGAATYGWF